MIRAGLLAKINQVIFRVNLPLRQIARRIRLLRNIILHWLSRHDAVASQIRRRAAGNERRLGRSTGGDYTV